MVAGLRILKLACAKINAWIYNHMSVHSGCGTMADLLADAGRRGGVNLERQH